VTTIEKNYDTSDVAEITGFSVKYVRQLIREGHLESRKHQANGKHFVRHSELERFLEEDFDDWDSGELFTHPEVNAEQVPEENLEDDQNDASDGEATDDVDDDQDDADDEGTEDVDPVDQDFWG
jgi:hypothetical protein